MPQYQESQPTSTHFVGHLRIEKVVRTMKPAATRDLHSQPTTSQEVREVSEVGDLTIKADELERLIEKLGKHVNLIEED